ncbi:MAG: hypothetical protein AAB649_06025, partial [Patescibacteria group bacterium]
VDTQLTDYSGRSVDSASEGARITGAGQQSMAGLDSTGAVSAAHNNADGEVSASSNVQGRGAIEQGINRIQQNAMSTDPQNALMTPIANDLQERQEAIQTEFQEQKDKGVIDRGMEALQEMGKDSAEQIKDAADKMNKEVDKDKP